jgi:flavodoxin
MKTMVVFDSLYGNTRVIAQAIADAIPAKVNMVHVSDVSPADIHECDLADCRRTDARWWAFGSDESDVGGL